MKKSNNYTAYALIGIGLYFFITQYSHPLIQALDTWPMLIIGLGTWLVLRTMKLKNSQLFTQGWILVFIGIHFYGLKHMQAWIDHWAMFPLMWGLAYFFTYIFTKQFLVPSISLIVLSLVCIFSESLPTWIPSFTRIQNELLLHWPLILIGMGLLFYFYKRK